MKATQSGVKKGRGLMVIAVFKFVKGIALLALGIGALHLLHGDVGEEIARWVDLLRIDPHSRYLIWLLQKLSNVDEHKLRELSVGTFFYAGLYLCEGTGLALGKRWAEYLTIVSTASLMPIEIYEIHVRPTWERVLLLVVNLIVVGYLVGELRRTKVQRA